MAPNIGIQMRRPTVPLNDLLIRHGIHPKFRNAFRTFVNDGGLPSDELGTRLKTCTNYAECLNDILERLSEPIRRLRQFQSPVSLESPMSEPTEVRPVTATDFLGNPISAGDTVVYPVRRGSKMWLNKLVVQSINDTPNGPTISGRNDASRMVHVRNLLNCVVK